MSQSLVIFNTSGKLHYQYNNKVHPFNELVSSIVNETFHEIEPNFFTTTSGQKRFYCLKRNKFYTALYFDVITTIDRERIKRTLSDIWKTYAKIAEEEIVSDAKTTEKLQKLIDYQVEQLMKFKQERNELSKVDSGAVSSANTSGTTTPVRKTGGVASGPGTGKKMRKWDSGEPVEVSGDGTALDYSESKGESGAEQSNNADQLQIDQSAFKKENDLFIVNELNEILDNDDDDEDDEAGEESGSSGGGFFSKVSAYFGSTVPIDSLNKEFYNHLISKNISPPTATKITEKIKSELNNQKQVTKQVYKQTLETELTKILTPNVSTDLLYEIKGNKSGERPFVISVVGVNGVGKSTNLAKLAYWFLQNDLNVLICACDTFRSGAVEQLKVHVNNLQKLNSTSSSNSKIDIFEKGYGGGDHVVATAKSAIQYAAQENFDIVLIDTAGRTHSNAKLMAPLKKFGDAANPDRIIMVGEALVGTDSVEQAQNFNNAFGNRRSLDFFIISKVDTVGDLVGTMINMVMATRVPILFVGTGQTYTDIKRLSVKRVVNMLTS
ncbi:signal recognition particle receptor subunit alpha homolog [[Candida] railenensis]|uniref:Signal recognition particle receptor subunit alpha homolog n=1 Tax=[Candida] railenensis TaxID=45579 RepID=A0A9P0QSF8_9ASCO|nr:signal recognition particle receptor subunit alpha homolog [[Candida] railenensis]